MTDQTNHQEHVRTCPILIYNVVVNCSVEKTICHDSWAEADQFVLDKVLTDERATAYASTIEDINTWWLECEECNWFKSKQTILSEARLLVLNNNY